MTFASIGDCCVDTYPDKKILGGTAYNSAIAARKYGVDVSIVTAIGNDANGDLYKKSFQENKIDYSHVQISSQPTSSVEITLQNNSPVFGDWELGALKRWEISANALQFLQTQDIAKMICLKPLEKQFRTFCDEVMLHTLKAGDFDGDSQYSFQPQEIEKYINGLDVAIKSLNIDNKDEINFLQDIAKRKNKIILVTLGKNGSICFAGNKIYKQVVEKILTSNTTGFGDTFIAVFLTEYFQAKNIQQALLKATQAVSNFNNLVI